MHIRLASVADAAGLLAMMRELAHFEGYLPLFRVTEADLAELGLGRGDEFTAFIAEADGV